MAKFVGSYSGKYGIYNMYEDNCGFFSTHLARYFDTKEELREALVELDNAIFIA